MPAAKKLIFTAKKISAIRALELGIVETVVEAGEAENEALRLARDIASRGPLAVRRAKEAIDVGMQVRHNDTFRLENPTLYGWRQKESSNNVDTYIHRKRKVRSSRR